MTHARTPLTFAAAATRVAGLLTWDDAARVVGRSTRLVYAWSMEADPRLPSVEQALALDAAYAAAGGEGAPFHEAHAHLLDLRVTEQDACLRELAADAGTFSRECGEAVASAIAVATTNAGPRERHHAYVQAEQAHSAAGRLLRRLHRFLPSGTRAAAPPAGIVHLSGDP